MNFKVSQHIREATMPAHQELEKIVVHKLKAIRGDADYAALLGYFYHYFSALEEAITPFITDSVLPDFAQRRKSGRLKSDLAALGGSTEKLPEPKLPEISDIAQAMGALYVMEGSVMGGGIIIQMLAKRGISKGVSFFSATARTPERCGKPFRMPWMPARTIRKRLP